MSKRIAKVGPAGRIVALPAVRAITPAIRAEGFAAHAARIRQAFARVPRGARRYGRLDPEAPGNPLAYIAVLRGRGIAPAYGMLRVASALPARRPIPFDLGPRSVAAGQTLLNLLDWMARNGHRRVVLEIR